ncbi:hypothetical protein HCH_03094 [Hahella chejuensis KCTC 2396]|uniref:Uncharacterized protein n=1 Tax=Hahella chejuensis (strain KCTC 2396) TaxID=349521 RepID=Q2SHL4_HAHCH|nr:hypothetical protein HCH_03094 [Hahella chejuensis KCTC 2396]
MKLDEDAAVSPTQEAVEEYENAYKLYRTRLMEMHPIA